jgi:hypothetical protein
MFFVFEQFSKIVLLTTLLILSTAYFYVDCRRLIQTLTGITAASTIRKNTLVFATTAMAANQVCGCHFEET